MADSTPRRLARVIQLKPRSPLIDKEAAEDERLEMEIDDAYHMLMIAKTEPEQRVHFERMKALCARRSERKIAAMERAKGLR